MTDLTATVGDTGLGKQQGHLFLLVTEEGKEVNKY